MRGKLVTYSIGIPGFGITPAYAGKTWVVKKIKLGQEDHPRVCGENHSPIMTVAEQIGSPPRMRGKPVKIMQLFAPARITPAYAGKTALGD